MIESHANALAPDTVVAHYQIIRVLGEGGFGITYLAKDTRLGLNRALKEYFPFEFATRQGGASVGPRSSGSEGGFAWGLERFVDEARTLAKFDIHPNIVSVVDIFEDNGTAYMAKTYQEGETLADLLRREGRMDEQRLREIIMPLLDGLKVVHDAEILHRDAKPSNIFLGNDGGPVLIDFGAARQALGQQSKSLSTIISEGYSPWEQYSTKGEFGPWTDIYSVAATMYRAISGHDPLPAPDRALNDQMVPVAELGRESYDATFLSAVDWALAVRPEDRPENIDAWRTALDWEAILSSSEGHVVGKRNEKGVRSDPQARDEILISPENAEALPRVPVQEIELPQLHERAAPIDNEVSVSERHGSGQIPLPPWADEGQAINLSIDEQQETDKKIRRGKSKILDKVYYSFVKIYVVIVFIICIFIVFSSDPSDDVSDQLGQLIFFSFVFLLLITFAGFIATALWRMVFPAGAGIIKDANSGRGQIQDPTTSSNERPIAGYLAVAAGLAGIFVPGGAFFVPLALILSLIALFTGYGLWGVVGLFLAVTGLLTSPTLLELIGLSAIAAWWT